MNYPYKEIKLIFSLNVLKWVVSSDNMKFSEQERIKSKILSIDSDRYWGDDFDIRYYLISKFQGIKNKKILDLGGGIGIILSEIPEDNLKINLDIAFSDLKQSKKVLSDKDDQICSNMIEIPFADNVFDYVISASVLQYIRIEDLKNSNSRNEIDFKFILTEKSLIEIKRVLKPEGKLFLVTPNNTFYKSYMFNYEELNQVIKRVFSNYSSSLYNTYPKISSKYRKLNLANTIPKLLSKIFDKDTIIEKLMKDKQMKSKSSVSFYVEAIKQ